MDYETKPISRCNLRELAKVLRDIFGVKRSGPFPVLEALEKIPDIFENSNYIVIEDKKFPPQTMARCVKNEAGGFTIEIRASVYDGAYTRGVGAFRGFICHEICHVFLFEIGQVPIYSRSFENGTIPAYRSVEWQAKALCAEVMIPYDETHEMKLVELMDIYHVSKAFAINRRKLEKRRKKVMLNV